MNFYQRMGISPLKARKSRQMQFHDKTEYVWGLRYWWDPSLSMNPVRQFAHFMPPCMWINWVIWQSRQSLKVVLCLLVVAGHSRKPVRIGMPRCLFRIKFLHALVGLDVYFMLQMSQLVVPNVLDSNYRKISFSICYKKIFFSWLRGWWSVLWQSLS